MKNLRVFILSIVAIGVAFSSLSFAEDRLWGTLVPISTERTSIVTGDEAMVNLGERDGVIKGDIGIVMTKATGRDVAIGRCVVTKSGYQSSVCEVISTRQEIERSDFVTFPRLNYAEQVFQPFIVNVLSNILQSYEPHKRVSVCVYGVFDKNKAVTSLSEQMMKEMEGTFSQKKRIRLVNRDTMSQVVFYPGADSALLDVVKGSMKKADIDVLILGEYSTTGDKINLTISQVDRSGNNKSLPFVLPLHPRYAALSASVVTPARQVSKTEKFTCSFSIKPSAYSVRRDERVRLIRMESGGNVFTQQTLQRIDFNLIHPVEIKIVMDDEEVPLSARQDGSASVTEGVHQVVVSFKRGYFYNESLMYTSAQEQKKVVLLDLNRRNDLLCEIRLDPASDKDAIGVTLYQRSERQRQVIKPVYRVESESTIERFKD